MTVRTPSDASEAQMSKNTDASLQVLWQTPADRASALQSTQVAPGPRDRLRTTMLRTLAAHEHAAEQSCSPADGDLHIEEALRPERDAPDGEGQAERPAARTARMEHALLEASARRELSAPEIAGLQALMDSEPCTPCGGTIRDRIATAGPSERG